LREQSRFSGEFAQSITNLQKFPKKGLT
jgi:hypothetical protein